MKYTPTTSAIALLLAVAINPAHAILNCKIQLEGENFDLSPLGGTVQSVQNTFNTPPSVSTTSWYINPCRYLNDSPRENIPEEAFKCPGGTQICGIQQISLEEDKEKKITTQIIPVAGDIDGKQSGANLERLRGDAGDGLRVHFKGGSWGDYGAIDAYIDFLCVQDEKAEGLVFKDWNLHTLNLTWSSRMACALNGGSNPGNGGNGDNNDNNKDGDKKKESSGWGFFTWLFVITLVCLVVYVAASFWISYNRYGQVDFDSLPFIEFLRDIPFVLRDVVSRIFSMFQRSSSSPSSSSSSRAGYAAV